MAASSTTHHHHHHRSSSTRSSSSQSSIGAFTTANLFKTNGRLATVGTTVGEKIPNYIPGFKTSATFLTSLSANLRIPDEALLPSPISTPVSLRACDAYNLPPPSPFTSAMSTNDDFDSGTGSATLLTPSTSSPDELTNPLDGIPDLSTYIVTEEPERVEALKLIADSVAQQRQTASRVLISHPFNLAAVGILMAVGGQILYGYRRDWVTLFSTFVGFTMACLVAVRWVVGPYLQIAEEVNWDWLDDDTIIATKYGDHIIGSLVLGWESPAGGEKSSRSRRKKGGKGIIRGWTVHLRYRGKGEGRALLDEAAQVVHKKGGDGLEFEEDNIYSRRVLPNLYNSAFNRRDRKAYIALDQVVKDHGNFLKRR
ncbi:hypothetical protein BT63DRAFT_422910 [Microthyrium microscopicum]|uniref:N-acetyltransferase domain-containing protein n=1 Tax=Microthyrium microscopicum TaxID=703497 RepID=A0A6A6UJQ9_9PEZI|nr:hypothetical protein BT63DRAFT_422910 [Microthyrium microscopicum]